MNIFHLYSNLGRAYEIALSGGFTIDLFYDSDTYPDAPKDFEKIKDYLKGVVFQVGGDLKVQLCQPDPQRMVGQLSKYKGEYETAESVVAKTRRVNIVDMPLSKTAESLLKMATERLNMGASVTQHIKNVASVIQQVLDEKIEISAEACAEAIHYVGVLDEHELSNIIVDAEEKEFKEMIFNLSVEEKESFKNSQHSPCAVLRIFVYWGIVNLLKTSKS